MLFLTHFPDRSDHFYAKIDKKKNNPAINKVRKFDLIARDCGEIAGGGEREDSYYKLKKRIATLPKNISKELHRGSELDQHKFGSVAVAHTARFKACVID